ncbi:peptide chain release factor N(5)-glutamine methyltransferase [Pontibacillus sp. ALD_SL1]|uniref:peptide chain release factor N(5)-glutamine methyltransferase n=1 Tax=Pontibacillus sp. ALD_SL1 TaxID=2777185 RepID=UPI001A97A6F5|nr:peptide chain release factor N(5)-glutamine methyltransferase [Pontibacillus sp. ALD_SL1]QSS99853.1 peptide chain release factor N(5)-glutamine methyltransferase [Pontibacillus sp. ALD_SL1]
MAKHTIWEARRWASSFLTEYKREKNVADLLLMHYLECGRAQLLANAKDVVDEEIFNQFQRDIHIHAEKGVPVQHLIGLEEFYGRDFKVNHHVLIPRPETEELIVAVTEQLRKKAWHDRNLNMVDVGTGSGIIAITLALELTNVEMRAVDLSPDALHVAKQNAATHKADIGFYEGSFLEPIMKAGDKMDVIVSNPPYIPESDRSSLSDVVVNHDPELALFAEDNGLAAYRTIVSQVPHVKAEEALLAFEIGHNQGEAVSTIIADTFPNATIHVLQDINQKDRIILAWL